MNEQNLEPTQELIPEFLKRSPKAGQPAPEGEAVQTDKDVGTEEVKN